MRYIVLAVFFTLAACRGHHDLPDDYSAIDQVGPYRPGARCKWLYQNGLGPFKKASTHTGFPKEFNPHLTVSRRGLTLRVIGTLSDETIAAHGSMKELVAKYPYVRPVKQTAFHQVNPENSKIQPPSKRPVLGEVTETVVTDLPPNTVMIVYPVSVAIKGYNTLAGNHRILHKTRFKNNQTYFGNFPYLEYTHVDHAFHGPVTKSDSGDLWGVKRGAVSHGCQRMEGEHIVELSVLLGCSGADDSKLCPDPKSSSTDFEQVTVMEEFDVIPNPQVEVPVGKVSNWEVIKEKFVGVDLSFPRDGGSPLAAKLQTKVNGAPGYVLEKTLNRSWTGEAPQGVTNRQVGVVKKMQFATWDNRQTSKAGFPQVIGKNCK